MVSRWYSNCPLFPWNKCWRNAKYEEALEKFESVLGSKPEPEEAAVASYNVACCYSKLNQVIYMFVQLTNEICCISQLRHWFRLHWYNMSKIVVKKNTCQK
jgi:hypothetical protein